MDVLDRNVRNINLLKDIVFSITQEESHVSILSVATDVSVQVGMRKIKMEVAKVIATSTAYHSFYSTDIKHLLSYQPHVLN